MCKGDDATCPDFEKHRRDFLETMDHERRSFLKSAFAAGGGAAALGAGGLSLVTPTMAAAAAAKQPAQKKYHHLPASAETVHWGYFSKMLKPQMEVDSGDFVTIEALTHHANDDAERMIKGDPGAESVYLLDQGQEEREPPRRRADGRFRLWPRRRRGLRRAHLHRPVFVQGRRTRRRARSAHPRRRAAPLRQSRTCRQGLRQQCRRLVGLSVQRPAHRAEAARGHHDLRARCYSDRNWAKAVYNYPMGSADRSVRRRAQDHRLSGRARGP